MTRTRTQLLGILSLILFFTFGLPPVKAMAQYDAYVSYNDFYQDLAPYGQWIDDPQYGYVWSPDQDGSFRPYYTNGHWCMTEYGNTWVSDFPWGWACFHYGRWTYDNYYGWIWIPGTNWGPAWVCWRYGEGYYGWSPLGPGYDLNSSMDYICPNDWWVFIPPQYLYSGGYYRYWYGPRGNNNIVHQTSLITSKYVANGISYVSGPHVKDIEKVTGKPVQVYELANGSSRTTTVHNNTVKMYRPAEVRPAANVNGQRPAPPNVVTAPQPIKTPQPVSTAQTSTPPFREDIPKAGGHTDQVGSHINQTAEPNPVKKKNDSRPYEWDVNRSVPQPAKPAPAPPPPSPAPKQQPPRNNPQPQPQPQQRPQPQPQPQPRPQPQPQQRPAPAPQQHAERR